MDNISGIYSIRSKIKPNRIYIGSSINISKRWKIHLNELRGNRHHSGKLQNHFNKYGIDDLTFALICQCVNEQLIKYEQFFIDCYKPYFNIREKADSNLGLKRPCSEDRKRKMSIAMTGKKRGPRKPMSEEVRAGFKGINKGRKATIEARAKMSAARMGNKYNLGHKASEETRKKLSEAHIGNKNGRFLRGIKRSEETKRKMSIALKKAWENRRKRESL